MNLDQLKQQAKQDLKIDKSNLDNEALRIPELHNKYLRLYTDAGLRLKEKLAEEKRLYRDLWLYYSGRAEPEVYQQKQEFDPNIKILKQDLKMFIEADPEYIDMKKQIAYLEAKVSFLEKTVSQIDKLSFAVKNAIDWKKYLKGYNF